MSASESAILKFYRSKGSDACGRSLQSILKFNFGELEETHDYIQWLFPLPEASAFNSHAPVLTEADITSFREDMNLQRKLVLSLQVMLRFYGFNLVNVMHNPVVQISTDFAEHRKVWLSQSNHNFLRITRILRCLCLLGCGIYAKAFLDCLEDVYIEAESTIGSKTIEFWRNAVSVH